MDDTTQPTSEPWIIEPVTLGELTGGQYLSSAEVAAELEISTGALRSYIHQRTEGRLVKPGSSERRDPDPLARLLPAPAGRLAGALVWRGEDIAAVAETFRNRPRRKAKRGE